MRQMLAAPPTSRITRMGGHDDHRRDRGDRCVGQLPAGELDEGLEILRDAVEKPAEVRRRGVLLHVARIERRERIEEADADRRAVLPDLYWPRRAEIEAPEQGE